MGSCCHESEVCRENGLICLVGAGSFGKLLKQLYNCTSMKISLLFSKPQVNVAVRTLNM